MLKRKQRHAVFEVITKRGLDPAQCDLREKGINFVLVHNPTDSKFMWTRVGPPGHYRVRRAIPEEYDDERHDETWSSTVRLMESWARDVKDFMNTPDPWAELRRENEVLSGVEYDTMTNAPFTPDEQTRIAEVLSEIKASLAEHYALSPDEITHVEARLDVIEEATHRVGRKDWLMMFYGTIFTLVVTALVPQDAVSHIINMTLHGLWGVFGFGGPPPALPPGQ